MKVFIVEDEKLAAERLQRLLEEIDPSISIMGSERSIRDAVKYLLQNPAPDMIFMDIELNDGQAFDIFSQVEVSSFVVFTTSYPEHALQAFKQNSLDYLLKPIRKEDLQRSLKKYALLQSRFVAKYGEISLDEVQHNVNQHVYAGKYQEHFLIQQGQRYHSIAVKDIAYFFVEGRLTFLVTNAGLKLVMPYTLEEVETMVDPALFYRANRSFIVQRKSITSFKRIENGKLLIALGIGEVKGVIVSKQRSINFKQWIAR